MAKNLEYVVRILGKHITGWNTGPTTLEFQIILGKNEIYPVSYLVPFTKLLKAVNPLEGYSNSQGTHAKVKERAVEDLKTVVTLPIRFFKGPW